MSEEHTNNEDAVNNPAPEPDAPAESPEGASAAPAGGETTSDERTMGMLCHIAAFAGYIIPFGNIIGPLIIWLMKKDQSAFVDDQGKESINFQITMMIAFLVAAATCLIGIGFVLLPAIGILGLVFIILAAVKANSGEWYRYPFAIRLIK